jgi:hypothetical protein
VVSISLFNPNLQANENTFQSKVKIKASYRGTQNFSNLLLRENRTFEDFNIGWFAYVHYRSGNWKRNGDTIFLNFLGEKPKLLGVKIIINGTELYKVEGDSLKVTYYHLEYSKN